MPQFEIIYPVIRFNKLPIDLTEDQYEQLINLPLEDQAKFIAQQNDEKCPEEITYWNLIEGALDTDNAYIKRLPS